MTHLRLTHTDLGFWIDVRLREFVGRWLAVADRWDAPAVVVGETADEALRGALSLLGKGLAGELAAQVRC